MKDPVAVARGRLGAFVTHSRHDSAKLTANARAKFEGRFGSEVEAEALAAGEVLTPAELVKRADMKRRAYFARLVLTRTLRRQKKAAMEDSTPRGGRQAKDGTNASPAG